MSKKVIFNPTANLFLSPKGMWAYRSYARVYTEEEQNSIILQEGQEWRDVYMDLIGMLSWIENNSKKCGEYENLLCMFVAYQQGKIIQKMDKDELVEYLIHDHRAPTLVDVRMWLFQRTDNNETIALLEEFFL